jgi:signal transduction histidine kinase
MNTLFYSFTIGVLLAIIVIFLIYFLKKIDRSQLQQIFSVNLILLITTCVFIFLQMILSDLLNVDLVYFSYFYYIGIVFFPVSLYFTVEILIHTKISFKPKHLLLFVIPLVCLVGLWTNEKTHLFFTNYDINLNNCGFGPFYMINEFYSYLLYLISIVKLIKFFRKNSGLYSQQLNLFLIGILFPFILNLLGILNIINVTVYISPISSAISVICFTLAVFKFQLQDTLPIALNKIVNRISYGYIVLNEKNIITEHNIPFLQIFEIEEMNIDSSHLFDILALDNFNGLNESTIISALQAVRDSNETLIFECEFKKIKKFLRLEINNIKSNDMFIGSLILVKDITEHHKDLEIIKSNQNMLIEKERLASLGQMISGVAHNLKTPIFSITGAAEGLTDLVNEYQSSINDPTVTVEDHLEIAHDMSVWLGKIKEYTSYMSDIITAIRGQAASFTENTFETFTIDELIKRVNILMKHELQQALITLNISYNLTKEVKLHGNINTLIQIINNLISNAIQAYSGEPNKSIDLSIENTDTKVTITITDYGVGIAPEVKDKLFKEIITTKGKDGTGLGLFISYSNLKTQFNGNLTFESELGKGTSFEITLPIQAD